MQFKVFFLSEPNLMIIYIAYQTSFGYGSTRKCNKIQIVKVRNLSSTLLIIGFRNYRENYVSTGQ